MHRSPWRVCSRLIPLVFAALYVGGCNRPNFSEGIPTADRNILRIAKSYNVQSLDPATIEDVDTTDEMQQVFEGLTMWGPDLTIQPCLAQSWKISNGGLTYTFELRRGVTFSNGDPFNAQCVKYSIERACNPRLKSGVVKTYMGDIVGVDEVADGKAKQVSGVKVLGPYRVEIDIKRPISYFLGKFAYNTGWIVDPKVVPFNQQITKPDQMIGTGPFICTNYVPGEVLEMKSNPHYWGKKASIAGVRYIIAKEPITRMNMFEQKQVDMVTLSDPQAQQAMQLPSLKANLRDFQRSGIVYLALDQTAYPPFANAHIRRAVAMAINAPEMVNSVGGGVAVVANGILPPGVLGHRDKTAILPFDPTAARHELSLAGYRDGSTLPPLKLYIASGSLGVQRNAEVIQSNLMTVLKLPVELAAIDSTTLYDKEDARQLPAYILGWYADYPDPQDFISLTFTTDGSENHMGYTNKTVDEICAKADYMPEKSPERLALYAKAEDIILQDSPWVPLSFTREWDLINPRVTGLEESMFSHARLNTVVLRQ